MADDIAIKVTGLNKSFKLPHDRHQSLKSSFISKVASKTKKGYEIQHVLQDINFDVKKGDFFGIVGRNGSGKSTLLKCLANIYTTETGAVDLNGTLTPFIELGVGFNPELTGRENVYLNGALMGFSRQEMTEMYEEIVEFAELEQFMDQKLKNYSSGMQVRLAFSIAIQAKSDILLLDEVLAVGDTLFQQKCFNFFYNLKKSNRTVLLVSHDVNVLGQYCNRGILIEGGSIIESGKIKKVLDVYNETINRKTLEEGSKKKDRSNKVVNTKASIKVNGCLIYNSKKEQTNLFTDKDTIIRIQVAYTAQEDVRSPVFGVSIYNASGARVFASNNIWKELKAKNVKKNQTLKVMWEFDNVFNSGEYFISTASADSTGKTQFDNVEEIETFKVRKPSYSSAIVNIDHSMEIE